MIQEKLRKVLFALLRAGLWNRPIDDLSFFPLSNEEWQALYQISKQHTVEGILFDALQQLDASLLPPRPLLLKWCVRIEKIEQRNDLMNQTLTEQASFFAGYGLEPLLLKGQGVAQCYIRPNHRICGDIDWYFSTKETYLMANRIVMSLGIDLKYVAGYSACYCWNAYEVDHHQRLFDLHNPFLKGYLHRLIQCKQVQNSPIFLQDTRLHLPAPILQILQVNTHILKHLLSFGIGLRQLCDAARLYATYNAQVDGAFLKEVYSKTNILKWIILLHQLLVDYIGLPKEVLPFELPENLQSHWMMEEIWRAGDFGFYVDRSGEVTLKGTRGIRNKRRLWSNFTKYLPYAPMEAISFPLAHLYSGITKPKNLRDVG